LKETGKSRVFTIPYSGTIESEVIGSEKARAYEDSWSPELESVIRNSILAFASTRKSRQKPTTGVIVMAKTKQKTMQVVAIRFVQNGIPYYSIVLTPLVLSFLQKRPQIVLYGAGKSGDEMTGYQRVQNGKKVESIAKYVGDPHSALVDPINLNFPRESGELVFKPISSNFPSVGFIELPDTTELNAYDGGHRMLGTFAAWERSNDIDFDLPATLANVPAKKEKLLFSLKNMTSDRIRSDLAVDLRVSLNGSLNEENGDKIYLPPQLTKNMTWLPDAREIARLLNESRTGRFAGNPWYKKMRYANEKSERIPNSKQWFTIGKFTEYLQPVARRSNSLLPESVEDRAVLVCNMWKALEKLVPDAFGANATDYRLATGHVSIEPLFRLVNSFMLYHLCKGDFGEYSTFEEAVDAVGESKTIPSVEEFIDILKKCRVRPAGVAEGKSNPLFTQKHWAMNGPSRHYHGKGNVSILVGEVNESLKIPPKEKELKNQAG
jgi:DGQHR domain-containing protein